MATCYYAPSRTSTASENDARKNSKKFEQIPGKLTSTFAARRGYFTRFCCGVLSAFEATLCFDPRSSTCKNTPAVAYLTCLATERNATMNIVRSFSDLLHVFAMTMTPATYENIRELQGWLCVYPLSDDRGNASRGWCRTAPCRLAHWAQTACRQWQRRKHRQLQGFVFGSMR